MSVNVWTTLAFLGRSREHETQTFLRTVREMSGVPMGSWAFHMVFFAKFNPNLGDRGGFWTTQEEEYRRMASLEYN